ncbi:MAG: hypothetical protein HQK53_13855 [Oligoflexia bacterium]|nr:hypothetical protein [Oligoflexia bacterium]
MPDQLPSNLCIVVSQCIKIPQKKRLGTTKRLKYPDQPGQQGEVYTFHFKGFLSGKKISVLKLKLSKTHYPFDDISLHNQHDVHRFNDINDVVIEKGSEYIMLITVISISDQDGALFGEILNLTQIDNIRKLF